MTGAPILVDGHVHFHACHDIGVALDAARDNLDREARRLSVPDGAPRVLWLVEDVGEGAAERLRGVGNRWSVESGGEHGDPVLVLRGRDGRALTVVLGRQVRTSEDLEVLVVGTTEPVEPGRPLGPTIEAGLEREALVMLPWGFGKWTAGRGRAIADAFDRYASRGVRLADTSARAWFVPTPPSFRRSAAKGLPVLAGSDPFPFPDQVSAVGRYGFVVDAVAEAGWPALCRAVLGLGEAPPRFGSPMDALSFAKLQVRMQVRKRFGGTAS